MFLYLDGDPAYLVSNRFEGFSAGTGPGIRPEVQVLRPGFTDLECVVPDGSARMASAGPPVFEVRGFAPGSVPRIRLFLHGGSDPPMVVGRWSARTSEESPARLRPEDAVWSRDDTGPAIAWRDLWNDILAALAASPARELFLSWRAEAEGASADTEIGRSPWGVLRFTR